MASNVRSDSGLGCDRGAGEHAGHAIVPAKQRTRRDPRQRVQSTIREYHIWEYHLERHYRWSPIGATKCTMTIWTAIQCKATSPSPHNPAFVHQRKPCFFDCLAGCRYVLTGALTLVVAFFTVDCERFDLHSHVSGSPLSYSRTAGYFPACQCRCTVRTSRA